VHNIDSKFFFQTNYKAPNGRIISFDLKTPKEENWKETLP
jgi:prolyl oligopeptidase